MFNGWSAYIFGEQRPPVTNGVGEIVDENNIMNEEDDWILVNDEGKYFMKKKKKNT